MGEEATRAFYEPGRFTRRGALPPTALMLLQDRGSVALLDGEAHRQRKAMFMSLMSPAAIARLADVMGGGGTPRSRPGPARARSRSFPPRGKS